MKLRISSNLFFMFLFFFCFQTRAMDIFPLPFGKFSGTGKIEKQKYLAELQIQPSVQGEIQLWTSYHLNNGETKNWKLVFKPTVSKNNFQVLFNGFTVGTAECHNEKSYCHYIIPISKEKLEESFYHQGIFLIRTGSKWIEGKKITWTEIYKSK